MSPYKIEMIVNSYTEDKEPLYKVIIYDKNNIVRLYSTDIPKEKAVQYIAEYCCVTL
jgi:hypothetical protein